MKRLSRRSDTITAEKLAYVESLVLKGSHWPFDRGPLFHFAVRYIARLRRGYQVVP